MGKRQADRLKDVVTELINIASGKDYTGDIAEDYPREWTKILRITGLHPDSKQSSDVELFKDNTFTPLLNVTELSDAAIDSFVIVESAVDKELIPLKVTAYDNAKQIVTGILPDSGYSMGFSYRSIRGRKS